MLHRRSGYCVSGIKDIFLKFTWKILHLLRMIQKINQIIEMKFRKMFARVKNEHHDYNSQFIAILRPAPKPPRGFRNFFIQLWLFFCKLLAKKYAHDYPWTRDSFLQLQILIWLPCFKRVFIRTNIILPSQRLKQCWKY